MNDWVGNWLAAYHVWAEVGRIRTLSPAAHHTAGPAPRSGSDLGLAAPFRSRATASAARCGATISGQTGWKQARAVFLRDIGRGLRPAANARWA
jgi:hypothetical protein